MITIKNMAHNQWETKQILDIVSKGVNSVLMNRTASTAQLKKLANDLTDIYCEILEKLKGGVKELSPSWTNPPTKAESEALQKKVEEVKEEIMSPKDDPSYYPE